MGNQSLSFLSGQPFFNQITAERMNLLANRSIDEIVGGMASQTPGRGWRFVLPRKIQNETRCYVIEGTTATSLPGLAPLDAINFDVAEDYTESALGTIAANVFTFEKPGIYHVSYTAVAEMDLSGATTPTPGHVIASAELKLGGVSKTATASAVSAPLTPNFDGFIKWDGTEGAVKLSMADLVVETAELTTESFVICDSIGVSNSGEGYTVTNSCARAITDAELVSGKLESTPKAGTTDLNTNIGAITDSEPSGLAYGTLCGQTLVHVRFNTSGELKIFEGASERAPTIAINGTVSGGGADILYASLSILQL